MIREVRHANHLSLRRLSASLFTAALFITLTQQPGAVSPTVIISQIYGGGGNAGAVYRSDFVEIFNRGSAPVSLTGWSIQYASATGTGNFSQNAIANLSGTL